MTGRPAIAGGKPIRKKFLPFYRPYIGKEEIESVSRVLQSGWIISGKVTEEFTERFRKYVGARYAIAVSSCTAGLHLSLVSAGIKKGDEVITSPLTFTATANVIVHSGARPVFADIDQDTLCINSESIKNKISSKTRAIIPVHIAGFPCAMDSILKIARRNKSIVIEDAAHAIGTAYRGRKIGTWGDATVFSFHAVKNITTAEGGMITTNDGALARRMRLLSFHGLDKSAWQRDKTTRPWYYHVLDAGYKYNLTDIQSAIGIEQLKRLRYFLSIRKKYAKLYNEAFKSMPEVITPVHNKGSIHSWHLYIIKLALERLKITRDEFLEALRAENIAASVHFIPLHLQPFYQKRFGYKKGDFPNAEDAYERIISLPLYPMMKIRDIQDVIDAVLNIITFYRK